LGHYSSDCPKCSAGRKTAARAEVIPEGAEEELINAIEGFDMETASEADYASAEEQSQDDGEHLDGDIPNDNDNNISLNDWCGHVRAVGETDSDDERVAIVWSVAIHIVPDDGAYVVESSKVSKTEDSQVAYRLRGTKDLGQLCIEDRPKRDFKSLGVIEGYMHINGQKAHVLLDGGSTINMISVNFASVHKLDLFQLKKPVKLQMATSGSCSAINFGAKAQITCGSYSQT
jgi:hypothetical protein